MREVERETVELSCSKHHRWETTVYNYCTLEADWTPIEKVGYNTPHCPECDGYGLRTFKEVA